MSSKKDNFTNTDIWQNIDPDKVRQRLSLITQRLEGVRHKFDPLIELEDFFSPKENPKD